MLAYLFFSVRLKYYIR